MSELNGMNLIGRYGNAGFEAVADGVMAFLIGVQTFTDLASPLALRLIGSHRS